MQIISHRGASKKCAENTIGAFLWAKKMRSHGVEMDIQITLDNILIVQHDSYDKQTGVPSYEMRYNSDKHTKLEDVFYTTSGKFETYILDIKDTRCNSPIVYEILKCIRICGIPLESCIFASFNEFHMSDVCIQENLYDIKIQKAYITGNMDMDMLQSKVDKWGITHAVLYKFQINKEFIEKLHSNSVKVYAYTCNTEGTRNYCKNIGCEGIITDSPDLV